MRSQKLHKESRHRGEDDVRDWYLIGFIALASLLLAWLPLLGRL